MKNRDWLCLALRLFGIWMLIQAVEELVPYIFFVIAGVGGMGGFGRIVFPIVWLIARTTFGLILVFFAPAIASRFHPSIASEETASPEFDESRILKVGIQLLAVYALLLAVQSGAGVILGILSSGTFDRTNGRYAQSLLTFGLNLAFAAILLIWNDQVIAFIAKFRYVAERDAYEPPPIDE